MFAVELRGVAVGASVKLSSADYGQCLSMARTSLARNSYRVPTPRGCAEWGSSAIPLRIGCECTNNGLSPITRQGSENFTHIVTSGLGHPQWHRRVLGHLAR